MKFNNFLRFNNLFNQQMEFIEDIDDKRTEILDAMKNIDENDEKYSYYKGMWDAYTDDYEQLIDLVSIYMLV